MERYFSITVYTAYCSYSNHLSGVLITSPVFFYSQQAVVGLIRFVNTGGKKNVGQSYFSVMINCCFFQEHPCISRDSDIGQMALAWGFCQTDKQTYEPLGELAYSIYK